MAVRHITKAKNHVFKNDDLAQVLHAAEDEHVFAKTKRESKLLEYNAQAFCCIDTFDSTKH